MTIPVTNEITLIYEIAEGDAREASSLLLPRFCEEFCRGKGLPFPGISRGEFGKPYFASDGFPYHLSVTHCGPLFAVAFAPFPIGLDAERISEHRPRIAARFFSLYERTLPFSFVWTAREAAGKCTGVGLTDALKAKAFPSHVLLHGATFPIETLTLLDRYQLAVARFDPAAPAE
ncbi:MAG: 4'-phosphopantetheinyl transferase superfamily protein [Clostridia bacterium]|nr:4'-phosphopantetheinyl transferase superfamily protein [Clostridia bacterium]